MTGWLSGRVSSVACAAARVLSVECLAGRSTFVTCPESYPVVGGAE